MPDEIKKWQRRIKIDKHALDEEVAEHPRKLAAVGLEWARAKSRREFAKEDANRVRAGLFSKHSNRLKKREGTRVTNVMVDAEVEKDAEFKNARRKYKEASLEADEWEMLWESWRARGFALKGLCELAEAQYYETGSYDAKRPQGPRPTALPRKDKDSPKKRNITD